MDVRGFVIGKIERYRRFIIFCTGGGLGAIVNWTISFLLTTILGVHYIFSYTFAQIVNIVFNFVWHRHITFKIKSDIKQRFIKFLLVSISTALFSILLAYLIKEFVIDCLYEIVIFNKDLNYLVAIIITTFIVAVINYLLNKIWVFKQIKT